MTFFLGLIFYPNPFVSSLLFFCRVCCAPFARSLVQVGITHPELMSRSALIFKALYDVRRPALTLPPVLKKRKRAGKIARPKKTKEIDTPLPLLQHTQSDVLSEEDILTWHASPPESSWLSNKEVATKVRAKCNPFVEWLKDADEESD